MVSRLSRSRVPLAIVIALGVLWPFNPAYAQPEIDAVLPGVVKIVATGATTKTGTGFVIARAQGDTYIVTAAHVVERADRISVFFYERPSTPVSGTASKIQADDPRGLALVTVSVPVPVGVVPLPLATDYAVHRGESVKGVGQQPSHGDWGVISGDVASRDGSLIRIQAPVGEQTSGGPVIRDGRVVGMFVSHAPNIGIAITALAVQDYLNGALPPGVRASAMVTTDKPATKAAATDTRRIVITGPKPLYAPFKTGDVFQECDQCPEMVVIVPDPNGFTIGTPESQAQWGRDDDERPFGPIRFARPYAIGRFEITRAQWRLSGVQAGGGCYTAMGEDWHLNPQRNSEQPGFDQGADHPVVCVSWDNAQSYLRWLNRQSGAASKDAYRLPSEAEWEYAARAGTTTVRYWGNEPGQACAFANVADWTAKKIFANRTIHECSDEFVYKAPVGRFRPNSLGLYDMIGNVWEWVQDCYAAQYSESIRNGSALETANCDLRVARGGAPGSASRRTPVPRTGPDTRLNASSTSSVSESPGRSDILDLGFFTSLGLLDVTHVRPGREARLPDAARRSGPALEAMYRFIVWLIPTLDKLPRSQKFLLGDRMQATALDVLEHLIAATYSKARERSLGEANLGIEKLSFMFRICVDLRGSGVRS